MRITLVRHGRTADNHGRIWQGWGGRGLDEEGRAQAEALARRLAAVDFDRVLSSDLQRVVETAAPLGKPVELDPVWREIDVGSWAGKSWQETFGAARDDLEAMGRGEDVRIGGDGESTHEFHDRVVGAFDRLVDQHDDGDEVLVLAHGGVIGTLVAEFFGTRWPQSPTAAITNTAVTTVEIDRRVGPRVAVLNDASHLGPRPGIEATRTVTFVRHGLTDGNLGDRFQGHTCSGLNDTGRDQAQRLGHYLGPQDRLWSSDLPRARETAEQLGTPSISEGLRELFFGSWEGLNREEVEAKDGELARRIYLDREDLPRGGDGESWSMLTERVGTTVDGVLADADGDVTFVSHGSAIRAYLLRVLGVPWDRAPRLGLLPNTGFARLVDTAFGTRLFDYGLAPHLAREPAARH